MESIYRSFQFINLYFVHRYALENEPDIARVGEEITDIWLPQSGKTSQLRCGCKCRDESELRVADPAGSTAVQPTAQPAVRLHRLTDQHPNTVFSPTSPGFSGFVGRKGLVRAALRRGALCSCRFRLDSWEGVTEPSGRSAVFPRTLKPGFRSSPACPWELGA